MSAPPVPPGAALYVCTAAVRSLRGVRCHSRSVRGFLDQPGLCVPSAQDVVLMRALRDMNLPKFVFEDVPLFLGLISDLFPGLDCPRVRYPSFNDAVEQVFEENGFVVLPVQVEG